MKIFDNRQDDLTQEDFHISFQISHIIAVAQLCMKSVPQRDNAWVLNVALTQRPTRYRVVVLTSHLRSVDRLPNDK